MSNSKSSGVFSLLVEQGKFKVLQIVVGLAFLVFAVLLTLTFAFTDLQFRAFLIQSAGAIAAIFCICFIFYAVVEALSFINRARKLGKEETPTTETTVATE